jgi:hypothetical protein
MAVLSPPATARRQLSVLVSALLESWLFGSAMRCFPHVRPWLRHRPRAVALLAAIALAAPLSPSAQPGEFPGFRIERQSLSAKLGPGATVVVSNPFGDVRARFGGYEGVVDVLASLQQFDDEGPVLEIDQTAVDAELRVVAGVRRSKEAPLEGRRVEGQRKRADLVVFVPDGVDFRVETDHGLIQVRGVRGAVSARSQSGNIEVRAIHGDVDLATGSGEVMAVLESLGHDSTQRIASAEGDIWLLLSEDGNYDVRASARGWISTDYSMSLDEADGIKQVQVRIGDATTQVAVAGGRGHLKIHRRPSAEQARAEDVATEQQR